MDISCVPKAWPILDTPVGRSSQVKEETLRRMRQEIMQ